jgi:hypothetical protein
LSTRETLPIETPAAAATSRTEIRPLMVYEYENVPQDCLFNWV